MKFTEETLEQAVTELISAEQIPHTSGLLLHKEMQEVLLKEDLTQYLLIRYGHEDITIPEINSIIRQLSLYPASALYESNKAILQLVSEGFVLKREDRTKKDLYIQLLDYRQVEA
ncbi:MAG: type I restriction endonuclease, partial [Flavobacteriales bacterium]|nr:type I restriction endonuclease [Flavobacteriales bacterium]